MWLTNVFASRGRKPGATDLVTGSIELTRTAFGDESYEKLLGQHLKTARAPSRPSLRHQFQSAMRSMKLALLSNLLVFRSPTERPKVALHKSRWMVLLHTLIHVPPLLGAVVLVFINLLSYFASYDSYDTTGLQFVAKFHELLMQASISAMLMDYILRQSFRGHVPFGYLFAPSQVSTASYLWSLDYWSAVTGPRAERRARMLTGLLIFLALALAALVGPSSAVAMIPRLVTNGRDFQTTELLLEQSVKDAFPSVLDAQPSEDPGSILDVQIPPPPYIFNGLMQTFGIDKNLNSTDQFNWTIVFPDNSTYESANPISSTMQLSIVELEKDSPLATVYLPKADVRDRIYMQYIRDVILANNSEVRAHKSALIYSLQAAHTAISVRCRSQDFERLNKTELTIEVPNYDGSGTTDLGVLGDLMVGKADELGNFDTIFIEPPDNSVYSKVAITDLELSTARSLITCGIRAVWSPATYEMRGDSDLRTVHTTPIPVPEEIKIAPLFLTDTWTEQLKNSTSVSNGWFLNLRTYKEQDTSSSESILTTPWEVYLAAIIAQGVSSTREWWKVPYGRCMSGDGVGEDFDYQVLNVQIAWANCTRKGPCPVDDFDTSWPDCGDLKTTLTASGFGYGITATSIVLALIVLSSYCVVVVVYMVLVLFRGTTSTALDSNAELVTLALQSSYPGHLGSTSVGIETMATLRAPVGIRVNSEQSLELVFRDDQTQQGRVWSQVEANRAY